MIMIMMMIMDTFAHIGDFNTHSQMFGMKGL